MPRDRRAEEQDSRCRSDQLRTLYTTHKDQLMTIATSLLGDTGRAEDVVHDVFVALADGDHLARVRQDLRAYLVACVANRARDQLRRRGREAACSADADAPCQVSVNPMERLIDNEDARQVVIALSALPQEQREVVALHLQGEMTFREIARRDGLSVNTVKSRYRYGMARLRQLLGAEVNGHERTG